jgi:hypothetical protein
MRRKSNYDRRQGYTMRVITFNFPVDLSETQEKILISYIANVRDNLINKMDMQLGTVEVTQKITWGAGRAVAQGLINHFRAIRESPNSFFILNKENERKYMLNLSYSLNLDLPLRKVDIVGKLTVHITGKMLSELKRDMKIEGEITTEIKESI